MNSKKKIIKSHKLVTYVFLVKFIVLIRPNFYQYILHQKEDSLLNRMLSAQKENPVKNNFYQSVNLYLKEFGIHSTYEEIRSMKPMPFNKIVKEKSKEAAFQFCLTNRLQGKREST